MVTNIFRETGFLSSNNNISYILKGGASSFTDNNVHTAPRMITGVYDQDGWTRAQDISYSYHYLLLIRSNNDTS